MIGRRIPAIQDVLDAAERIGGRAIRTPVLTSSTLDAMFGARLFFKCENFQHSYDDARVIAGQGTVALELLDAAPELDLVLTPIGGGLTGSTALTVKSRSPATRMVAVEPQGADDAYRSFRAGERLPSVAPRTIADGLLTSLGVRNFALIQRFVDDVVTVGEAAIIRAMRLLWERMKIVVEPSAAVPLAALVEKRIDAGGRRVGIVLSGGNVDLERLPFAPG